MESIKRSGQRLSYAPCVFFRFIPGIWKIWEGRTPRLRCSQEKHLELHRILAKCLESGDFVPYEIAIKAECPQVTDAIAKIYSKRIATLPSPFSFKLRGYLRQIGTIWHR